jgi:hypothetical protein
MAIQITLSDEQEQRLMDWARQMNSAEAESGCEPSGYELVIGVSAFGTDVQARHGKKKLDLGSCVFETEKTESQN